MSVLADFIVTTPAEAARYDGTQPLSESHRASYHGFTEVELGCLYHITQGKAVDEDTLYAFEVVSDDGEGKVTTVLLPDLVSRLAAAPAGELHEWAERWGETEELDCSAEELIPVLGDLCRLSKVAVAEGKAVYLWSCL